MKTIKVTPEEWLILIDLVTCKADGYSEWLTEPERVHSSKALVDEIKAEREQYRNLLSKLKEVK